MNRHGQFCRTIRLMQEAPVILEALPLGFAAALASGLIAYDVGSKDALGVFAVGPIVCITLIPALFVGMTLTTGRKRRWNLSLLITGIAACGGAIGLCSLADEISIELLLSIPLAFGFVAAGPAGLILIASAIGSAYAGSYLGDRLAAAVAILPSHCKSCGYNLAHIPSDRCPECGDAIESTAIDEKRP